MPTATIEVSQTPEYQNMIRTIKTLAPSTSIYLTGSYARRTQTKTSDIDLLVITDPSDKPKIVDSLRRNFQRDNSEFTRKLDCKIISRKDCFSLSLLEYGMLLFMLTEAILIFGQPFTIHTSANHLRDYLQELKDNFTSVKQEIVLQRNYAICAYSLFSTLKSLLFLEKFVEKQGEQTPIREILGSEFYVLEKIYEQYTPRGIYDNLVIKFVKRGQRSGNFNSLNKAHTKIEVYLRHVEEKFFQWYDLNNDL